MIDERIVSPKKQTEDENNLANPVNLRPQSLADFVGQRSVCENLKVFIVSGLTALTLFMI